MADKYINPTGLQTIKEWINNRFALGSDLSALQTTVDGLVAVGAQANVIETVQKNGVALTVTNKTVNVTVPTAVTDLSDANDYATKTYVDTYGGKIDKIEVNGVEQTITNKTVDITVPTQTSQLTNNSNFVSDASYVHTDNNFTTTEKNKLAGIAAGAEVNVNADWNSNSGDSQILNRPTVDSTPTQNSTGLVTSGGVYSAIQSAVTISSNLFWCTYGTTTWAQIADAITANQLPVMSRTVTISSSQVELLYIYCGVTPTDGLAFMAVYHYDAIPGQYIALSATCARSDSSWSSDTGTLVESATLNSYVAKSGATMTGALTLSGAPTSDLQASTKKYVDDSLALKAPLASPALTGTPTAPTATAGTSTTQIATTAFVGTAISGKLDKSGGTMTGALTLAGAPTENLQAATKKYVDDGLATKQGTLTFDSTPTSGSTNPVTSGGVYSAIPRVVSALTNDSGYQTASQVETAINTKIASAYIYKGSVATYNDLPASGNVIGDVYDVQSTGVNYAWTGTAWDALGSYVDTSLYWAKTELTAMTTSEITTILNATS